MQRCVACLLLAWIAVVAGSTWVAAADDTEKRLPNVVIIFTDDQGYGDVGCFGAKKIKTPHLDSIARNGTRFSDFYVPQAVCSASRAGLLTGCYPNRIGILHALTPNTKHGIADSELTLGELLKSRGYATAIFGKWHLGHQPRFLPTRHGFDEYFGLPYSNDMAPVVDYVMGRGYPPLPLFEGEQVVQTNPDQTQLTTWYTEHALAFIDKHKEQPFFVYVPHSMPHMPIFASDKFRGKSAGGAYGDVIEEIDWSVGQILAKLKQLSLEKNTLVMFAADNGPWLQMTPGAGSAGPLREGKLTAFEGGVRTPCLMQMPDTIPAGRVCREPLMTIDMLPTLSAVTGAALPSDRIIDGKNIWPVLTDQLGAKNPHDALLFYWNTELHALRWKQWKLHLPHSYPKHIPGEPGKRGSYETANTPQVLYDLSSDPGETTDVASEHADVVKQILAFAEIARGDLGDSLTKREGPNVRKPGTID